MSSSYKPLIDPPIPYQGVTQYHDTQERFLGNDPGYHFSINYEYVNGFSKTVTLVDRTGLRIRVPPTQVPNIHHFVIRVKITCGDAVKMDINGLLNSDQPYEQMYARVLSEGTVLSHFNQVIYTLDHFITLDQVDTVGGNLYLSNLDLVISTLFPEHVAPHPYSDEGARNYLLSFDKEINNATQFGYTIKIFDPDGEYGERFININNTIYKIPVSTERSIPKGVYIINSGSVQSNAGITKPVSKHYTFDEADEALKLYQSVEQARTLGDEYAQKEKELKEQTLKIKEKEQSLKEQRQAKDFEYDEQKRELERRVAEEEARRKESEHQLAQQQLKYKEQLQQIEHERSIRMMGTKDYYDHRAYERKDSSEIVKFIPAIITGGLAIFVAMSKLK